MSAIKPFLIPTLASLIGISVLFCWAYDDYLGWGKFVIGALFTVGGFWGISEAADAREETRP